MGEHQGKALTAPRGHHGMALGVPKTHRRDSSTHTWAPRHVWCAPCGHNGTGSGVAYLIPTQARGCLSLVRWANWGSHGRNATAWWGTRQQLTRTHDAYAQHRGAMPCAPRRISHGRNAMVRCYRVGPNSGSKQHA